MESSERLGAVCDEGSSLEAPISQKMRQKLWSKLSPSPKSLPLPSCLVMWSFLHTYSCHGAIIPEPEAESMSYCSWTIITQNWELFYKASLSQMFCEYLLWDRVLVRTTGTCYVDQARLELTEISCLCLLSAEFRDVHHHVCPQVFCYSNNDESLRILWMLDTR